MICGGTEEWTISCLSIEVNNWYHFLFYYENEPDIPYSAIMQREKILANGLSPRIGGGNVLQIWI